MREQDALAAAAQQQQKQLRQEGSSGKGNSNQLDRKQGAALLPKRTSSAGDAAAGASAGTGNGSVRTGGTQSGSQLGSTAQLDPHAQQQVYVECHAGSKHPMAGSCFVRYSCRTGQRSRAAVT